MGSNQIISFKFCLASFQKVYILVLYLPASFPVLLYCMSPVYNTIGYFTNLDSFSVVLSQHKPFSPPGHLLHQYSSKNGLSFQVYKVSLSQLLGCALSLVHSCVHRLTGLMLTSEHIILVYNPCSSGSLKMHPF